MRIHARHLHLNLHDGRHIGFWKNGVFQCLRTLGIGHFNSQAKYRLVILHPFRSHGFLLRIVHRWEYTMHTDAPPTAPLAPNWVPCWFQNRQHHFPYSSFLSACLLIFFLSFSSYHSLHQVIQHPSDLLSVPFFRTSLGARSFSVTGPRNLELSLPSSPNVHLPSYLPPSSKNSSFPADLPIALAPSFARLRFTLRWSLCAFISYIYLLTYYLLTIDWRWLRTRVSQILRVRWLRTSSRPRTSMNDAPRLTGTATSGLLTGLSCRL